MKWAILCDKNGRAECGSDGHCPIDGRLGRDRAIQIVREYRDRYRVHFPCKVARWTHVIFTQSITGEGQPIRLGD